MHNCPKCNSRGYTLDSKQKPVLCHCRFHDSWIEYIKPVKSLILSSNNSNTKCSKLADSNQVITNTFDNIAGLMQLMLSYWFPEEYIITSFEEINTIGFKRHNEYKSIHEFSNRYKYFIVDMTIINSIRAKSPGWNNQDTMFMLDLIKAINLNSQRIIIIINSEIRNFLRHYKKLCKELNDFGIQYYHSNKYNKFTISDDSKEKTNG